MSRRPGKFAPFGDVLVVPLIHGFRFAPPVAIIVGPLRGHGVAACLSQRGQMGMPACPAADKRECRAWPRTGRTDVPCLAPEGRKDAPCLAPKGSPNSSHGWSEAEPVVIMESGTGPRRGPTSGAQPCPTVRQVKVANRLAKPVPWPTTPVGVAAQSWRQGKQHATSVERNSQALKSVWNCHPPRCEACAGGQWSAWRWALSLLGVQAFCVSDCTLVGPNGLHSFPTVFFSQ
jgi:hypothetical protein